jgi:surfactin synthase thioesterase subunit
MPGQEIAASLLTAFTAPNDHTITTKNHEQNEDFRENPSKKEEPRIAPGLHFFLKKIAA